MIFLCFRNEYNLSENLKFEDLRKPASDNSVQPSLEHSSCEDLPASVADEEEEAMTQPAKPERSSTAVGQSSDDRGGGRRTKQPLERSTKVASHRRTLQAMLEVFAKFHTPKVFYRQEELHQLYLEVRTVAPWPVWVGVLCQSGSPSLAAHSQDLRGPEARSLLPLDVQAGFPYAIQVRLEA